MKFHKILSVPKWTQCLSGHIVLILKMLYSFTLS